jgi:quercetin dioxygenase-like cupin family protein
VIIKRLEDFTRGWLIGDFEPSLIRTKDFEVGILTHIKGEVWPKHYHKLADEYNVLVKGKMTVNGTELNTGDVFIIEKNEVSEPKFLEDCTVLVIKIPSIIGDKYEV